MGQRGFDSVAYTQTDSPRAAPERGGVCCLRLHVVFTDTLARSFDNSAMRYKIFGMRLVVIYFIIIYLLRPKAAQHNITITKTEETQELKTKIYKNRKQ